jgi:hypothetical protein
MNSIKSNIKVKNKHKLEEQFENENEHAEKNAYLHPKVKSKDISGGGL